MAGYDADDELAGGEAGRGHGAQAPPPADEPRAAADGLAGTVPVGDDGYALPFVTEYVEQAPPADETLLPQLEHRAVSSLCRYPLSVAEVAAKLSIPLGVARVILSDMAELGLISIHRTFADDDIAAHLVLMERVLSGLRRL